MTIDNSGDEAYEKATYGDKILIQRQFDKSSSTYKIKNEAGKTISQKREVLDSILNHYEIIIDNPMSILTQDAARSFLTSTSTSKVYKYLSEGIRHEIWKMKNAETISNNNGSKTHLVSLHSQVKQLAEKKDEAQREYNKRKSQEESQIKLRKLKGQLAWKQVEYEEGQIQERENELVECQQTIAECDAKHQQISDLENNYESVEASLRAELREKEEVARGVETEYRSKQLAQRKLQVELSETRNTKMSVKKALDAEKQKGEQLELMIEEEDRNLAGGYDQKRREMREKLDSNKTTYESVSQKLEKAQNQMEVLRNETEALDPLLDRTKQDIKSFDKEISEYQNSIQQQRNQNHSHLAAFGRDMEAILQDIDKNSRLFKEKPIGPIGRYVALKIPVWGSILNQQLSNTLQAFAVSCDEDKNVLFNILKKYGQQGTNHSVFVAKKDLFDYRASLPDSKFTTVLDALDISDEHVKRILINNNRIESTILIENRKEAEKLMYPKPPKVHQCYSLTSRGDGCIVGGSDRNSSGSSPIFGWTRPSLLKTNSDDMAGQWRQRLEQAKQARNDVVKEQQQVLTKRRELKAQTEKIGNAIAAYRQKRRELQTDIDNLQEDLSEEADMTRRNALETQLEECKAQAEKYDEQYTDSIILDQEIEAKMKTFSAELRTAKDNVDQASQELEKMSRKLGELNNQKLESSRHLNQLLREKRTAEDRYNGIKQGIDQLNEALAKTTEAAQRFSEERLSPEESIDQLIELVQQITSEIRARENGNSKSLEQVTNDFHEAHLVWKESKDNFQEVKTLVKKFYKMQSQRENQYQHFLRLSTGTICGEFTRILSERNFEGYLKIDHINEKIELYAAPRNKYEDSKKDDSALASGEGGRDPRSLSGGEKSFSQIAFLLAVWKCMGSKVRGLDEFDVFMDDVNRQQSMKLMIEAVKSSSNVQTIFITPNNMSNMNFNPDEVRIHLMADPR